MYVRFQSFIMGIMLQHIAARSSRFLVDRQHNGRVHYIINVLTFVITHARTGSFRRVKKPIFSRTVYNI